jgi:hypothetical protein
MDTTSVAPESTEERDRAGEAVEEERDRLYDALAALPFEERIAAIELMAKRMSV